MNSDTPPDQIEELEAGMHQIELWQKLNETIKWSWLCGGATSPPS
jgi:hypothetical protein